MIWDSFDLLFGVALGFALQKDYYKAVLPIKVTKLPPEPPKTYTEWTKCVEPLVQKLVVGSTFGTGVAFNSVGAGAVGRLLKEMAENLDTAVGVALAESPKLRHKILTKDLTTS